MRICTVEIPAVKSCAEPARLETIISKEFSAQGEVTEETGTCRSSVKVDWLSVKSV